MKAETDFEAGHKLTCVLIDGNPVDPNTVDVSSIENSNLRSHSFELRMSSVILMHELEQAGVDLDVSSLDDFVREDLHDHGGTALRAYLGIVQAVAKLQHQGSSQPASLWLNGIEAINLEKDVLVISGHACGGIEHL